MKKDDLLLTEQIPEEYHKFIRVFDEEEANRFPESRVWDHKIELKEGFQPKSFKTYNLTPEEQKELDAFLKENLKNRKGIYSTFQIPNGNTILGQHTAQAHFRHYLTTCATIFASEKTLQDLQNSCDYVFAEFITPDIVHCLQPFLIQTQRRSQIPPSTTVITNVRRQQQTQTPTPPTTTSTTIRPNQPTPTVRIPHALHDNAPIVVTVPNTTPAVVRTPTPIPPPLVAPIHYVSPLLTRFDPCVECGSATDGHFPGCTK